MVARHIMKPDTISIKIVENCQAKLVTFSVVRLWTLGASSIGPVHIIVSLTRRPFYTIPIVNLTTSPEVPLSVFSNQSKKLSFLSSTVETDSSHAVSTTECLPFTLGELGASHPPAHKEILSLIAVIWFKLSATASSSITSSLRSPVSVLVSIWSSVWSSILLLASVSESVVVIVVPVVISISLR